MPFSLLVLYLSLIHIFYKSGSYEINDRAEQTLSKIAKIIMDYKDYDVLIEGNTDNVPINTSSKLMQNIRNNWDLSALRASSVVQYLIDHFGVAPNRLNAGGRGELDVYKTQPLARHCQFFQVPAQRRSRLIAVCQKRNRCNRMTSSYR